MVVAAGTTQSDAEQGQADGAEVDRERVRVTLAELRAHGSSGELPLAVKSAPLLPLSALDPVVFERVVAEMIAGHDSPSVHFYGRPGQKQYGLDVYEERQDGTRVLYQVKRYTTITEAQIRGAVTDYATAPRTAASQTRRFNPQLFVVVTSAPVDDETAKIDAIADLNTEYSGADLRIAVWGAERVSAKLRAHPNLVYAIFGEAWAREFCGDREFAEARKAEEHRRRINETLKLVMAKQFNSDNDIRFRQADLTGVTVEALFVDVPVSARYGTEGAEFLARINPHVASQGTADDDRDSAIISRGHTVSSARAGAAQALLHPEWQGSAVVVGGPGQGKSTLLQYLCQFFRARALDYDSYTPVEADLTPVTTVTRSAIRLDLPLYADWRRQRLDTAEKSSTSGARRNNRSRRGPANTTLEAYAAKVVSEASGQRFSAGDLRAAAGAQPMLIALDGLDEVAVTDEREAVADEIRDAHRRIHTVGRDTIFVIATRPGFVHRPIWQDPQFTALFLEQLTAPLKMRYLERWSQQSRLVPQDIQDLKQVFEDSITMPHVAELAGNPMQLAILLHLMQQVNVLPERRSELYRRYVEVFMQREGKFPIVKDHMDVVVDVHMYIAWHIHTNVERGQSTGAITVDDLDKLLTDYLVPRGHDPKFIKDLFKSVKGRVLCLTQRELDSNEFHFEVQPLREYFAARYLYDRSVPNAHAACFAALLTRPYWSNVMRFFAGMFTTAEVPSIAYALRELQSDSKVGDHPLSRAAAKLLLDDKVFSGQLEPAIKDMVNVILTPPGTLLAADGLVEHGEPLPEFHEHAGRKQAIEVLSEQANAGGHDTMSTAVTISMLGQLRAHKQAAASWWSRIESTDATSWLQTAALLGALDDVAPEQRHRLVGAVTALGSDASLLMTLVQANTKAVDDVLVSRCIRELKSGYGDLIAESSQNGPYVRLVDVSGTHRFYEHLRQDQAAAEEQISPQDGEPAPKGAVELNARRVRVRSESTLWRAHVEGLENAHLHSAKWDNAEAWHTLFDAARAVWDGDCWPVREALLAIPRFAYPADSDAATVRKDASWRDVARWMSAAHEHRQDSAWWRLEIEQCSDDLASATLVAVALTAASATVICDNNNALTRLVTSLPSPLWASTSGALQRLAALRADCRMLNLADLLRTRRMRPNGRLAVLMWHVSTASTQEQLHHFLAADLGVLWGSGPTVSQVLRQFITAHGRKLPVEMFRAARPDVPAGTVTTAMVKPMTYQLAQEVLREPQNWPTDIVRLAADHLGRRLDSLPAIAEVAAKEAWFNGSY